MSAFTVGAGASTKDADGKPTPASGPASSAPAAFVKWIPGEALTFYAAILGLGAAQGDLTGRETPQQLLERIEAGAPSWFFVGSAIAVALVVVGAISERQGDQALAAGSVMARAALALISFTIWTTALPGAWPYGWNFIRDMGAAYALLLVPIAAIFSGIAEHMTRRFSL
jgi:hypothetical protein